MEDKYIGLFSRSILFLWDSRPVRREEGEYERQKSPVHWVRTEKEGKRWPCACPNPGVSHSYMALPCCNPAQLLHIRSSSLLMCPSGSSIQATATMWEIWLCSGPVQDCRTKAHSYMVELELKGCCASETASPNTKQFHSVLLWAHLNHTGTLSMVRIPSSLFLRIIIITNIESL